MLQPQQCLISYAIGWHHFVGYYDVHLSTRDWKYDVVTIHNGRNVSIGGAFLLK